MNTLAEKIMSKTQGGKAVFTHYKVPIGRNILSPLNSTDKNPSFNVFYSEAAGKYCFKDHGESGWKSYGDCIDYVRQKFGLSFADAVAKIINDLKLK